MTMFDKAFRAGYVFGNACIAVVILAAVICVATFIYTLTEPIW